LRVSILIAPAPPARSPSITGTTRAISSSAGTV
jgi:hypothetical protein